MRSIFSCPRKESCRRSSLVQQLRYENHHRCTNIGRIMSSKTIAKLIVIVVVAILVIIGFTQFGDGLSLESLATQETQLREYQASNPQLVLGLAFVIYVAVTGLSLPGAAVLTLVFGWYFGFWQAIVLVSFASTTGATLNFLLSRYLFRDAIQNRFGERLKVINENLEKEGAFYLFSLRLIPAVPFFIINPVMGLTKMKTWTFWWVSQLGMLAGTAAYAWAGASVPSLQTLAEQGAKGIISLQMLAAFILLGIFPIAVKKFINWVRPSQDHQDYREAEENVFSKPNV